MLVLPPADTSAAAELRESRTAPGHQPALHYVTTTAVPLAVTISIEPFWPTVS